MKKEELEKALQDILKEGHDYVSCSDDHDISLEYVLIERKCRLCLLSVIAMNL